MPRKNILTTIFSWILWPDTKEKVEILTSRLFSVAQCLATCSYRAALKRASAFSTFRTERGKKARISSSL